MENKGCILMKRYEVGRMLGQGTFAKVYLARNLHSSQNVAIKVIDKDKVIRSGLIDQIKREISVMRLVRHPNIVQLYEVLASRSKIYFVMEYVRGGELFDKVSKGRLKEDVARKYFQQCIDAVDFCHSRGVYHRDIKPENLLVDDNGDLKISDFGLSATKQDGLTTILHTTCGTPAYVAPEIINKKGYDGSKSDIWSSGVVLYVLLAGFLPFSDSNLMELYRKIIRGHFRCPQWFHPEAKKLVSRILDPNPNTRITIAKIKKNVWFKKGYEKIETPPSPQGIQRSMLLKDVDAAFDPSSPSSSPSSSSSSVNSIDSQEELNVSATNYNAFDIISQSKGLDLSGLFETEKNKRLNTRFTSMKPASKIISKLQEIALSESFYFNKEEGKMKLQGWKQGRKGQLMIDAEIFEVTPSFYVVEFNKTSGDTIEYKDFCDRGLKPSLKDIVWAWEGCEKQEVNQLLPS
ncbi:CBL-interacting serine/threonine-protein kinase 20 [Euphorbia lathyris]|uniref:CBL-interacting serine/threonine-protein kinase 20 n=1 Tax=Euphorbia lathyris TaxID=212925 RepID=UPI0033135C94